MKENIAGHMIDHVTITNRMLMFIDDCVLKDNLHVTVGDLLEKLANQYNINALEHAFFGISQALSSTFMNILLLKEKFYNKIPEIEINEQVKEEWGLQGLSYLDNNNIKDFARHLKNAISHSNVDVSHDGERYIVSFFDRKDEKSEHNMDVKFTTDDLHKFQRQLAKYIQQNCTNMQEQ